MIGVSAVYIEYYLHFTSGIEYGIEYTTISILENVDHLFLPMIFVSL